MVRIAAAASVWAVVTGVGIAGGTEAQAAGQALGASQASRCFTFARQGSVTRAAVDACGIALTEEPLTPRSRAGTLVNRGVLHMNRGDHEAAGADFEAALQLQPRLGEAYFNRGSLRVAVGRLAEGVADIDESLRLGFDQPEKAYYNRAVAREKLSDPRGAYEDYREAARLKPDWELPRAELARFSLRAP
jgi:tetratricopeptide (TPR) repeat protein